MSFVNSRGPGMCLPDHRNLACLQTIGPCQCAPRPFEMCPSLSDNNQLWHFLISPAERLKSWWCGIISVTLALHHLVQPV